MEKEQKTFNSREGFKKISILLVLKALEQMSDNNNPIKQTTLAKMVNDIGGRLNLKIWCDRKTIGRHIKLLVAAGYNIISVKGAGYYLESNKLTKHEFYVIEKVVMESNLPPEQKDIIVDKLLAQQNNIDEEVFKKMFD